VVFHYQSRSLSMLAAADLHNQHAPGNGITIPP
jgi:hypothetical protein